MKKTQEFEGKNIESAIDNACQALNITKKKLNYDVISSGSTGIFGIVGVKKAKIRVTLPTRPDGNNDHSRSDLDSSDREGVMSIVDEAFGTTPETGKKEKKAEKKPTRQKPAKKQPADDTASRPAEPDTSAPAAAAAPADETPEPEARTQEPPEPAPAVEADQAEQARQAATTEKPADDDAPAVPGSTDDSGDQAAPEEDGADASLDDQYDAADEDSDDTDGYDGNDEDIDEDDPDEGYPPKYKDEVAVDVSPESIELGRETLQRMVDLITTGATVVAEADQDKLLLKVEGGNSGVLIGRRGQTLEAMQFLTDKIINRKSQARVRLKIDIEGYMETRKSNLISLAHKMADKAKKTGKPATINQMTAQDRRTVHLALKDDSTVRTQSMGDGYYRRLVIFPKKGSFKKRRAQRK